MITTANRLNSVEEYYFSKKLTQIKNMCDSGLDIINLGIGSPDLAPSQGVLDCAIEAISNPKNHGYQGYKGVEALRIAMANFYKKYFDIELDANSEILPLLGSKEGIMHISMAFLNPGDVVLVPNPGYPTYTSVSNLLDAKIVNYPLDENNNWQPDFDFLNKLDLSKVKIMWVNYPNMPTGVKASAETMEKLVALALKNNFIIVNDNPYSFVLNDQHFSILSIKDAKKCAIEINSLSKSSNMAGWRVGMMLADKYFIENTLKVKSNMDSGMFYPVQAGAIEALKQGEDYYSEINKIYASRKVLVRQLFDALSCTYSSNDVGMFVWAKVPKNKNAVDFSDEILEKANVFITPGSIFGSKGKNYLRISLCTNEDRIAEATERIKKYING